MDFIYVVHECSWNYKLSKGVLFRWAARGWGFGELTFYQCPGEPWKCDSERTGCEFVTEAMQHYLRTAKPRHLSSKKWAKRRSKGQYIDPYEMALVVQEEPMEVE